MGAAFGNARAFETSPPWDFIIFEDFLAEPMRVSTDLEKASRSVLKKFRSLRPNRRVSPLVRRCVSGH